MTNMTDEAKKKMDEAAENFKLSDIQYPPLKNIFKTGYKDGLTEGRKQGIREVVGALRGLICGGNKWADTIEQHFADAMGDKE